MSTITTALQDAQLCLELAGNMAERALTPAIYKEAKESRLLTPYETLEWKYPEDVSLRTVAAIVKALEIVRGELVRMEADGRPLNLKLTKTRSGFAGHGK